MIFVYQSKMSVLNVQFGQCGNQVGFDLYKTLSRDLELDNATKLLDRRNAYFRDSFERWFDSSDKNKLCARAILIDTEPKVINSICRNTSSLEWTYNPKNVICRKDGGSGNNWALGYSLRSEDMKDSILECIRKEVEKHDRLSTFHCILSAAGGTGSGVGSKIITSLREEYPTKCLINTIVLPYRNGEIITQNYNIILTLSEIYAISDMNIVFQNDKLHKMCSNIYGSSSLSMSNINGLIGTKLVSFLQPLRNYYSSLQSIVSELTPHPHYKFVSIKSGPHASEGSLQDSCYSNTSWSIILKYLTRTLQSCGPYRDAFLDWNLTVPVTNSSKNVSVKYVSCIANMLISRGDENIDSKDMKDFCTSALYPEWIPDSSRFYYYHQSDKLLRFNKFLALISNNNSLYSDINDIIQKAWVQFSNKAYVHHYSKYMSEADIFEAFARVEDIAKCYKNLGFQ